MALARRTFPTIVAVAALLASVAGGARAESIVEREGVVGLSGLADIQDSPGAVCTFTPPWPGSLGETLVRVNPPVMFAVDSTPETDRQPVGWRASVSAFDPDGNAWITVAASDVRRDTATDQTATYFGGEGWIAGFLTTGVAYNVGVEMLWFDPAAQETVTGRVQAVVDRYALLVHTPSDIVDHGVHSLCRAPE